MTTITDSQVVPITVGVSFVSSDTSVLTVQQDPSDPTRGIITAVAPGNATITVGYTINVGTVN